MPCSRSPGEDINEASPDNTSSCHAHRAPEGPVLDGVPLTEFGADQVDEPITESVVAVAGVAITPGGVVDSVGGAAHRSCYAQDLQWRGEKKLVSVREMVNASKGLSAWKK